MLFSQELLLPNSVRPSILFYSEPNCSVYVPFIFSSFSYKTIYSVRLIREEKILREREEKGARRKFNSRNEIKKEKKNRLLHSQISCIIICLIFFYRTRKLHRLPSFFIFRYLFVNCAITKCLARFVKCHVLNEVSPTHCGILVAIRLRNPKFHETKFYNATTSNLF